MERRLLLTRQEAAEQLNMSLSHFQRHVQPYLPCVYSGRLRLYRPEDLEEWAKREAVAPREGCNAQEWRETRGPALVR